MSYPLRIRTLNLWVSEWVSEWVRDWQKLFAKPLKLRDEDYKCPYIFYFMAKTLKWRFSIHTVMKPKISSVSYHNVFLKDQYVKIALKIWKFWENMLKDNLYHYISLCYVKYVNITNIPSPFYLNVILKSLYLQISISYENSKMLYKNIIFFIEYFESSTKFN